MSPTPSSLSSSAAGPLRSLEKSSGKKGKKFASVDWMLSLVDTVNKDEDKGVAKKLERMEKIKQVELERKKKLNQKKRERAQKANEIKRQVLKEAKEAKQAAKKANATATGSCSAAADDDDKKKRVSFQV